MAYQQRPAQRPPPVRSYGARPPPQAYGPPPDAYDQGYDYGYDNQAYQQGDGAYDDGSGYRNDYASPRSYGPPRGQPRPPRGGYGPPMDPYDRNYAYGRPPPDARRGAPAGRRPPPRGGMRPPPQRQPPPGGERMGWDNPFPNFPPGGPPPRGQRRPSVPGSVERGMAAMDINGPGRAPERPHTSNGRRPDRAPGSPGRGRGPYPPGGPVPIRSTSAGRPGPGSDRMAYTDPNGPPPMPPVSRSATMPIAAPPVGPPVGKPVYPGQATYQDPGFPMSGPDYPPSRPGTSGGYRPGRGPPPVEPGRDSHENHDTDDLLDSYYGSAADDPDMPNFDAMPDGGKGGIDDVLGLETPKTKTPVFPDSPGGYAAYNPRPSGDLQHSESQRSLRSPTEPSQFATAGFQFDLPGESPAPPPKENMGYATADPYGDYQSQGAPMAGYPDNRGGYPMGQQGSIRSNGPPQPYRMNNPQYANEQRSPANEREAMDPQQNPDALPHHPVPFRPGLDQGKPAPVRQYNNAPNNAAPPTAAPQVHVAEPVPPAPVTREELQQLQQMAKNKSDHKTQLLLAQKMVEAATVLVDETHLDPKSKAKAREKYVLDAHKIVKKLVSNGYPEAQFYLADCYGSGQLGLAVDNKEAFNLYHSAAKNGHAQSAYRVAVCCEIGQEEGGGTKRDPFKAVQWYKRAASYGDTPAMYKVGMILLKGLLGQTKNPREGISWLKRAAERADFENPHALHELALMYGNASGNDIIVRDEEYARQLFHQAAELGYKFSQFRLGAAYEYGLMGCPVDPRQSIIWYTHAAAQGEHQSELALSGWYLTGSEGNLQQSDTEAYLWARKAASAGLSKAEYAMGYFTETGIGVTANLEDAKRWYWRAAAQGFGKARERLEDLKKGGGRMQKTRVSRSQNQNEGDCIVM
ncbi:hypothetical protein ASPWEDRAFT_148382 [Aspergillus wentii DTO 134E9]|uniref:Chitin synthase activator (Chs3) n=1 Tax=Aspergillus wentii DTO 134E9 TaxID=1073089 RepID=A0A1L9RTK9_ASPWE|nr:uncharacterized protein ASPWEDRAFT_148382 [Aspergillus wentii DTO 134E9]OJJ38255.1 hypothetical protein ASPWEDRAFT_148382 [Aspergillus wentii DTO 134E9]